MKGIYIFLANGFEDIEAIAPIDILRRAGLEIKTVSIYDDKYVTSSHGVPMVADMTFGEFSETVDFSSASEKDIMIFPGGLPGSTNLAAKADLINFMNQHYTAGGSVAAICAAPSTVLSQLADIKGKVMTCYDGFEGPLVEKGAAYVQAAEGVAQDGRIITGRGPGFAISFGLAILAHLAGDDKASEIKAGMLIGC